MSSIAAAFESSSNQPGGIRIPIDVKSVRHDDEEEDDEGEEVGIRNISQVCEM